MDNRCVLFDKAILTDDDWTRFGDDRHTRMNDTSTGHGDITGESTVITFANNRLWHNFQSKSIEEIWSNEMHFEAYELLTIYFAVYLLAIFVRHFFLSFFLFLILHLSKNQHRDDVKKHKYCD